MHLCMYASMTYVCICICTYVLIIINVKVRLSESLSQCYFLIFSVCDMLLLLCRSYSSYIFFYFTHAIIMDLSFLLQLLRNFRFILLLLQFIYLNYFTWLNFRLFLTAVCISVIPSANYHYFCLVWKNLSTSILVLTFKLVSYVQEIRATFQACFYNYVLTSKVTSTYLNCRKYFRKIAFLPACDTSFIRVECSFGHPTLLLLSLRLY